MPEPGEGYPRDCALNACIAGGRFFHRLDASSPEALANLPAGLETVNIAQGYAKCSVCVVDGRSVITADRGIAKAALSAGLDVLTVTPGYIELEGFDCGFIGGASFKLAPGRHGVHRDSGRSSGQGRDNKLPRRARHKAAVPDRPPGLRYRLRAAPDSPGALNSLNMAFWPPPNSTKYLFC